MEEGELLRVDTLLEFRLTKADELSAFAWADPGDVPFLQVGRTVGGFVRYFREGIDPARRQSVDSFSDDRLFTDRAEVAGRLGAPEGPVEVNVEERYHVPGPIDPAAGHGASRQGSYFVWMDGPRPLAWAWTVREHGRAAQGSVQRREPTTPPELAARVLAAWAASVVASGKVAFFRHRSPDDAAARLALGIGAVHYATTVRYG